MLLAAFPSSRIPVVAATACVVPFLLHPAAALGRLSPRNMKWQCLDLVAAFLLRVLSAVCTRQPPTASMLARIRLPAWSSVQAWLLRLRTGYDFAPERLPAPDPVLHMSAPVRRGAVADARLGVMTDLVLSSQLQLPRGSVLRTRRRKKGNCVTVERQQP